MPQYLLPCACGAKVAVSRSQAGMTLPCPQCQTILDVPTIRKLSELETVDDAKSSGASERSSHVGLRILTGILLLVGIGASARAGYLHYERYRVIQELKINLNLTEKDYISDTNQAWKEAPLADTWDRWNMIMEEGLSSPQPPDYFRIKRYIAAQEPEMYAWTIIGTVCLALFAVLTLVLQYGSPKKKA